MKTEKITVNKTPENPAGIEIEIVQPEGTLEERLLSFLLMSFVRELKRDNRIPYDLPQQFQIQHRGQGTFLASGFVSASALYEPPRPVAILGIRHLNGRFDLIHAAVGQRQPQAAAQPAPQPAAVTPSQPAEQLSATQAVETTQVPQNPEADDKPAS